MLFYNLILAKLFQLELSMRKSAKIFQFMHIIRDTLVYFNNGNLTESNNTNTNSVHLENESLIPLNFQTHFIS